MAPRRSVAEHRTAVSDLLCGLAPRVERVALRDAVRRRLAENVVSPIPLPVFDNSQMDGYAVRSADLADASPDSVVRLAVGDTIPAGRTDASVVPTGTAVPIMTGAPIPVGADAVVPIEVATPPRFGLAGEEVGFAVPVEPGRFVRRRGCDVAVGDPLVSAGEILHARRLGLLAAAGIATVSVQGRLRVLLLSTGSELREPGEPLAYGQIHDANTTMLAAALTEIDVDVETARVPDQPAEFVEALRSRLEDATNPVDLVVTSGGVSAGAFEVVKDALGRTAGDTTHLLNSEQVDGVTPGDYVDANIKVDVEFGSVAMQPGGPQGLGRVFGVPLLAFPGNPVSAWVSFEVFLRPVLRRALGHQEAERPTVMARLAEPVTSPPNKHQLRRGTLRDTANGPMIELISGPGSHLVGALAHSNALAHLPVGVAELPAGAQVMTWRLDNETQPEPGNEGDLTHLDGLTHLDDQGAAHMVDVSAKSPTRREATAAATVRTTAEVITKLKSATLKKGDALGVARISGIMAAKRTSDLVPLCHPLPLTSISVDLLPREDTVEISATVGTTAVTGVEMEALTAASVAGLTLYDMIKALDPAATIEQVAVVRKTGGKTGEWVRDER